MNVSSSSCTISPRIARAISVLTGALLLTIVLCGLLAPAASAHAPAGSAPRAAPHPFALAPLDSATVTFTLAIPSLAPDSLGFSHVAWGDYDNDGDLDLLLEGCAYDSGANACTIPVHAVYHNAAGVFTMALDLPSHANGPVAWGDADNDGDLDILRENSDTGGDTFIEVLANTVVTFTPAFTTPLDATALAWGDFDNDGKLDILAGGYAADYSTSGVWVYRNTGSGFTQAYTVTVDDAASGVAAGDYDNDGRLDVLVSTDGDYFLGGVYRNTGSGFTRNFVLPDLSKGDVAWGDYDNDGWLDFLLVGRQNDLLQTLVYHNTGLSFSPAYTLTGYSESTAAWGDYDNDGWLDLMLTGALETVTATTAIYHNDGGAGFSVATPALPGVTDGSAAWGDYDNDGRLDIVLTGCNSADCNSPVAQVYRNETASANTAPGAPANLRTTVNGSTVTFQWDAAADSQTAAGGLSYNLVVTPSTGLPYALAPMADAGSGDRRLPALGNAQSGLTATLTLPDGEYRWRAQAIDAAWAGGAWAAANSFAVGTRIITPTAGAGGSISPSTPQSVKYGGTRAFTIAANTGYTIRDVGVDGVSVGAVSAYTFMNVTANHIITAAFAINTYVITPTAGAGGSISPGTPQTVNYGETQVFAITATTGYHILDVGVDGASVGAVSAYTFTNVTANHTITAAFAINTYNVTTATTGTGSGSIILNPAGGTYDHGTVVTATATAAVSSNFTGWSGACVGTGTCSVTIDAPKSISAAFTLKTYTVTPTAGAGGSISPNTAQTVNHGSTAQFTVTPNPGYQIVAVTGCSGNLSGATYTTGAITESCTVSATYTCAPVITVQNTSDTGAGSLRQAVADACPGAMIDFAPGLSSQTIPFASQIVLDKNLTISGTVPVTLSGNNATRIFAVSAGTIVSLHRLTLTKGAADSGGGIRNDGTLTVQNSTFSANLAISGSGRGAGIYNDGTLTVQNSTFANGSAIGAAGIFNAGLVTVTHSTFSGNAATSDGAGIYNDGTLTVQNSTFSGNSVLTKRGGGIYNNSSLTVTHSTFSDNSANTEGGGIYNNPVSIKLTVQGSVFSGNNGGNCIGSPPTSDGYNVSSDGTCNFTGRNDINNAGAQTQALLPNGAAPLLASSLAINNVTDPALCAGTDQLGNPRPTPCAAGAVEFITPATTRYVATTGNDAGNNCLNAATPCATLARALEQAVDNNTIRVITGAYLVANQPISKSVLILGAGSGQTILQANATAAKHSNGRVFAVAPGKHVTLAGLTVRHGWSSGANASGGGIANVGVLTVRDSAILSNTVEDGGGGAIYTAVYTGTPNSGALVLYNSTLAGNRVFKAGASAAATAGALPGVAGLLSFATVLGVTWNLGRKRPGRAWQRRLPPLLVSMLFFGNCTCTNDPKGLGGALFNDAGADVTLRFSSITHNRADSGGGVYNVLSSFGKTDGAQLALANSVLSQNSGGDCGGQRVNSLAGNVASDTTCALGNATDTNGAGAQVAPLQANGVAPLLSASAAIDRVGAACPVADQVGVLRPVPCDAGAAEFTGTAQAHLQAALRSSPERPYRGQTVVYTAMVRSIGPTATGVNITLALPAGLTFGGMTQRSGPTCTIASNTAACGALARGNDVTLVAQATVAAAEVGMQLNATVTAQAANSAQASATFLVITKAVPPPPPPTVGCGDGSYPTIQAAVEAAPAGATIEVCAGTYKENVTINKNVTIRGRQGAANTIVDGMQRDRVFDIKYLTVVTLEGLTIRNGVRQDSKYGDPDGGGIKNLGMLTINNSVVSGNSARFAGGILNSNVGTLTVNNSLVTGNSSLRGAGIWCYGTVTVNNSTFSGNRTIGQGAGISNAGRLSVNNSIFSGNQGESGGIFNARQLTVNNSALQDGGPGGNGNKLSVEDARFVNSQQGNLHLKADSPARSMGQNCPATDLEGRARPASGCSAGAYEFSTATANGLRAQAQLEPQAAATTFAFTSFDGAVSLDIPADAVTQTVTLAFNLGRPTGGDPATVFVAGGRAQGVVFTAYDAANQPLPADFTFAAPLTLALEYDPALVTGGLEVDLRPMRFEPATGGWLPFTTDITVDKVARTITFPIWQAGEYGLFTTPPAVYTSLTAASAAGVHYLDGGATVLYTLAALNGDSQLHSDLALRYVLPAGLTFVAWVNDDGAVYADGVITWSLPALAAGGLQFASFDAQVSADAAFWGQAITSTATLTDAAGLNLAAQAIVSVNGPTTAVNDSVTTRPGEMAMLWPLLNDLNPDGSPLVITALGSPTYGVATILGDTVLYTPTAGFEGNDSFSYTVQDGQFSAQGEIQVRVARLAFLSVFKTVAYNGQESFSLADVPQGAEVVYTLDLANGSGGEIAQNVVLTDVLPAGVQFSGWITQSGATLDGGVIRWSANSVPTQTVTTLRFRATVVAQVGSTVANSVQVAAANADSTEGSASFVVAGPLPPQPVYLPLIQRAATVAAGAPAEPSPTEAPFVEATPVLTDEVEPESPPTETPFAETLPVPANEVEPTPTETPFAEALPVPADEAEPTPTETPFAEALPVPADEAEPTPTETPFTETLPVPADEAEPTPPPTDTPVAEASPVPTAAAGQSEANQLPFESFLPLLQQ